MANRHRFDHEWLTLAILAVPIVWRAMIHVEFDVPLEGHDPRGLLSDLAAGLVVLVLVTLLLRVSKIMAIAVAVLWSAVHAIVFEHVLALGELPSLTYVSYLFDPTFIGGSVLHPQHPWLIAAVTIVVGWSVWRLKMPSDWPRRVAIGMACFLAASITLGFWSIDRQEENWRQTHALQYNLKRLMRPRIAAAAASSQTPAVPVSAEEKLLAAGAMRPDLSGTPRFPQAGDRKPNVLLIVVESLSGSHIQSIREQAGIDGDANLPFLDSLSRQYLVYPNFINQQRQTSRGMYALLAGDLPKFFSGTSKMTEIAGMRHVSREFLPSVLRRAGYATMYLQAAPLGYMMKDQFMTIAGFETVLGDTAFPHAYARSSWGVDDRAFFEQSADIIQNLHESRQPWFVTLLTVGTHHPYVYPDDFQTDREGTYQTKAFAYADEALRTFFDVLQSTNLLDDTLVIITSDESVGLTGNANPVLARMSHNWGVAIVITPDRQSGVVAEPYVQSDLPLSVIDYLGLETEGRHFIGRSMFRTYADPRHIFFAHTHGDVIGAFDGRGEVHVFNDSFEPLVHARYDPESLFRLHALESSPRHEGLLYWMGLLSSGDVPVDGPQLFQLAAGDRIDLTGPILRYVTCAGQYFHVEEDAIVRVRLDIKVDSSPSNFVIVRNRFTINAGDSEPFRSRKVGSGRRFRAEFLYRTGGPMPALRFAQSVTRDNEEPVELIIDEATLEIIPIDDWRGLPLEPDERHLNLHYRGKRAADRRGE